MAITITKPTVGGSEDTWGDTINTALDTIVDAVNGTSGTTAPNLTEGSWQIGGTVITPSAADLNVLDGLAAQNVSVAEIGYLDGVTSDIQTQLDAKAPKASPTFTGTLTAATPTFTGTMTAAGANFSSAVDVNSTMTANKFALDNGSSDWTFEVSSNNLIIKYAGTAKMKLDTSGNLTITGAINASGTIS